jgi:hypothetical protein
MIKNRRSFSRVSKLLALFGYGASTPYNVASLKKSMNGPGGGAMMKNGLSQWFQNRMEDSKDFQTQLADWKEMVTYSPVAAAIRLIVDECIQTEHSCPGVIWADGGDSETEEIVNKLYKENLECEDVLRSQFWWVVSYGNDVEKLILGPEGVHGWRQVDLDQIERVVDEQRRLVGFDYKEEKPPEDDNSCVLWGDNKDKEKKIWRPWDFCHIRLMGEERGTEYGTSLLKPGVHIYKKLKMSEDQMITYRLQLQPSRYLMKLDTGEGTTTDVWELVNQWHNYLRTSRSIDAEKNEFEARYNPWALDDLIILPVRSNSVTEFTKLDGDSDVPDITDVKYLMRLLAGMLNVPPEFLGIETDGGSSLNSKSSLAIQDLRFLRSIKAVRAAVMQSYDKVARIHLALLNKDPFIPFRVKMSNITALESESQMELVNAQADLADKLIQLGTNIKAPKEEWMRLIFTKFMPLPDELVDIISIGSMIDDGADYQPLPAGPDFNKDSTEGGDLGGDMPGAKDGEEGPGVSQPPEEDKLDLPDLPQEGFAAQKIVHEYLTERRQRRAKKLLEHNVRLKRQRDHYFHPATAFKRYQKRTPKLIEGVTSVDGLVNLRKDISKKLEESQKGLGVNRPALRKVGDIIRLVDGYYPEFFHLKEEDVATIRLAHQSSNKTRKFQTLQERLVRSKGNQHEMVSIVESARATTRPRPLNS